MMHEIIILEDINFLLYRLEPINTVIKLKPHTPKILADCNNISETDNAYPIMLHGSPVKIHDINHSNSNQMQQNTI